VDLESLKGMVFNHVHTFFGRYYVGGEFLSKRRYSRRQGYAGSYNDEEVYLYGANADPYYEDGFRGRPTVIRG
jgi:adenine-specific DNA-methyltransferase